MKKLVFILLSLVIMSCEKEQILEDSNISNLVIYPNPSTGFFTVNFQLQEQDYVQTVDINIINKFGEIFASDSKEILSSLPIDTTITVDTTITAINEIPVYSGMFNLENTPKGIYFVEIVTKDGFLRKELILLN